MTEKAALLAPSQDEGDSERARDQAVRSDPEAGEKYDEPSRRDGREDLPVAQAALLFARGGGRTFVARQAVPYPFHVTRPHYLDAARPDLATLYLQSASGGLYRGDRLGLAITARPGTAVHVTSQAATVVHAATSGGIVLETRIDVHADAVLALTTDPYVLFPDTGLSVSTDLVLHPGAKAFVADGFAAHDPAARQHAFRHLALGTRIHSTSGRTLVEDHSRLSGAVFAGPASPLGPCRAFGSALLLGSDIALDPGRLQSDLDAMGVLAGASTLPHGAGWGVRLLAPEGGALRRGLDAVFETAFLAFTGERPTRRRK